MRFSDFEALIQRLAADVPGEFVEGVDAIEVSRGTLPHPTRPDVYTLGECIPLPVESGEDSSGVQSVVVLYHGSFEALARLDPAFDWRKEAWETLTHELRHHLEWRARAPDLEEFDWAAEQNFARQAGERFDPGFHLVAERVTDGVYRIDDDFFLDQVVDGVPPEPEFAWHGVRFRVAAPSGSRLPLFLTVTGVPEPPPGELVLVLRRQPKFWDLLRRQERPGVATAAAQPVDRSASDGEGAGSYLWGRQEGGRAAGGEAEGHPLSGVETIAKARNPESK
jgi:hypothetical protein